MIKATKGILSIVVVLVLVTFILSSCQFVKVDPEAEKQTVVAVVSGEDILKGDILDTYNNVKMQIEQQSGKDIWAQDVSGKKYIDIFNDKFLDSITDNRIQMNKAKELGIEVTEDEINAEVDKARKYFDTEEQFNEYLSSQNVTLDYFKDNIKTQLTINKLMDKITADVKATDEEIRKYYDTNPTEFDMVKASHILLDTEEKANEILAKVKAGEDFNALAKEYSTDPTVKDNSGELGYFKRGEMVPEFENKAFSMQPGEISDIVQSQYGYHIIKVEDRKVQSFDDAKAEIEIKVLAQNKDAEYSKQLDEWRTAADIKKYPNRL